MTKPARRRLSTDVSSSLVRFALVLTRSFTSGRGGLTMTLSSHRIDTYFLLSQASRSMRIDVSLIANPSILWSDMGTWRLVGIGVGRGRRPGISGRPPFSAGKREAGSASPEPDLFVDVSQLDASGPPATGPRIEFYGTPVRLAVVVVAPAGRQGELPPAGVLPGLMDRLVPGLAQRRRQPSPDDLPLAGATQHPGFCPVVFQSRGPAGRSGERDALVQHCRQVAGRRPPVPGRACVLCEPAQRPEPIRRAARRSVAGHPADSGRVTDELPAYPANNCVVDALAIWQAGVAAVDSARLVAQHVGVDGRHAADRRRRTVTARHVGGSWWSEPAKRAPGMAAGLEARAGRRSCWRTSNCSGWVNVPADCVRPLRRITLHAARPAGVNEPTPAGVEGCREILRLVEQLTPDDLCICLLSGGGSALLPAPVDGITLAGQAGGHAASQQCRGEHPTAQHGPQATEPHQRRRTGPRVPRRSPGDADHLRRAG